MRRFIAVFSLSIFIFIHFLSFQPVSAVSSVDYGEMLNTYLGAAETALAASQGVNIDWSNLELPEGSDTWTDHQKAEYVVSYIGNLKKVGQHAIYDWLFGSDNDTQDIISAETAAIGLANNSNIDTFDIKSQLDQALLFHDQQNRPHIYQRYSDKIIARWNEYNTNYINDYLDLIDETSYIEFPQNTSSVSLGSVTFGNNTFNFTSIGYGNYSAYINGTTYNDLLYPFAVRIHIGSNYYYYVCGNSLSPGNSNVYSSNGYWDGVSDPTYYPDFSNFTYPYFLTLSDALAFSRTGYVISGGGIAVSLPDAVIDNSNDDGKIVAHPIYYPDVMNTDKAIDIDLDKVVDAIAQRISDGASDITFDDLVDAGAVVKLDGTSLTDADTVVKDVSVPIAKAKVDTIDGVIPTIDVVPPLPPLPPIIPGDYSGEGFSGMSVLARIVNSTVQSLPAPIILTFFGVVFGAVILGIIKILHH